MPISSQNDIVEQYMMTKDTGKEVTDKLRIPDLASLFLRTPSAMKNKVKTTNQKILGLTQLHTKPKDEVAEVFISQCLERRGIVGFEWRVGTDTLTVSVVDGFTQKTIDEPHRVLIKTILVNALKARKSVTGIKWELGSDYIEISYIA